MRVQVSRVDLDTRKIDFRLVREGGGTQSGGEPASSRRRGRGSRDSRDAAEGVGTAQQQLDDIQRRDREVKRSAKESRGSDVKADRAMRADGVPRHKAPGKKAPSRKSTRRRS